MPIGLERGKISRSMVELPLSSAIATAAGKQRVANKTLKASQLSPKTYETTKTQKGDQPTTTSGSLAQNAAMTSQ